MADNDDGAACWDGRLQSADRVTLAARGCADSAPRRQVCHAAPPSWGEGLQVRLHLHELVSRNTRPWEEGVL